VASRALVHAMASLVAEPRGRACAWAMRGQARCSSARHGLPVKASYYTLLAMSGDQVAQEMPCLPGHASLLEVGRPELRRGAPGV